MNSKKRIHYYYRVSFPTTRYDYHRLPPTTATATTTATTILPSWCVLIGSSHPPFFLHSLLPPPSTPGLFHPHRSPEQFDGGNISFASLIPVRCLQHREPTATALSKGSITHPSAKPSSSSHPPSPTLTMDTQASSSTSSLNKSYQQQQPHASSTMQPQQAHHHQLDSETQQQRQAQPQPQLQDQQQYQQPPAPCEPRTDAAMPFLRDFNLVAEAAKRAQMAILMRDLEAVGI